MQIDQQRAEQLEEATRPGESVEGPRVEIHYFLQFLLLAMTL